MPLILEQKVNDSTCLGVWKITESAGLMEKLLKLDDNDKEQLGSISNELRKKHWLGHRLVLKELKPGQYTRIIYDEFGKPVMPSFNGYFSVSHSGDFAAAIMSDEMVVGIDIEMIRDRIERVAERFLSPEELSWSRTGSRIETLIVCWGAKESLYKSYGKPDIDFQKDIRLEPFDYLCIGEGKLQARMKTPEAMEFFNIWYRKIEDYMLVWAIQN